MPVPRSGAWDPGIKTFLDVSENQTCTRAEGGSPLGFQAPAGPLSILLGPLVWQVPRASLGRCDGEVKGKICQFLAHRERLVAGIAGSSSLLSPK